MTNKVNSFQLKVTSYNILADAYTRHLDDQYPNIDPRVIQEFNTRSKKIINEIFPKENTIFSDIICL